MVPATLKNCNHLTWLMAQDFIKASRHESFILYISNLYQDILQNGKCTSRHQTTGKSLEEEVKTDELASLLA
jgi:hypothetical protein